MKQVEYFFWMLPPPAYKGPRARPYKSTFMMSRDEAEKRFPGATPILETLVVRDIPETAEEQYDRFLEMSTSPAAVQNALAAGWVPPALRPEKKKSP